MAAVPDTALTSPVATLVELPSPFPEDPGVLRVSEPPDCDRRMVLERVRAGAYDKPFVFDDGRVRSLHFCMPFIQSEMALDDPYGLKLAYTRKMMSFLLFVPEPAGILMLGLGGGSLAKYCHRNLPRTRITVLEIDPGVLAFREQFLVPPDDERFRVLLADGGEYVRRCADRPDVIVMDAFDRHGYSPSISGNFYADVREALGRNGLMVANLVGERAERIEHLEMMRGAFGDNILVLPVEEDGNHVAFAFRNAAFEPRWRWMDRQAKAMRSRYGLDFPRFAGKLERSRKMGYLQRVMQQPALINP